MTAIIFTLATFVSTFLGGLLAIRLKNNLHAIMAFTAGVILAVFSFDILPEIIDQIKAYGFNTTGIMIALVVGFFVFHIMEKTIVIHHAHENDYADHKHPQVGVLSAVALIGHSFMDGIGIGLGFQINSTTGILVAMAVIAHDFTDGMNTVSLMLSHHNSDRHSKIFLLADALAPILGALAAFSFTVSPYLLTLYLAFFAGFLLYIGASDILPEAHSHRSSFGLITLTILGVALIFVITRFI